MSKNVLLYCSIFFLISCLGCASIGKNSAGPKKSEGSLIPKNPAVSSTVAEEKVKLAKEFKVFPIYTDRDFFDNHYTPSGYMGDYNDITLKEDWSEEPHSGQTCIKVNYTGKGTNGAGWAGVYWQNPASNWGTVKNGGFDLTGAAKLTFWARGANGGELIAEFKTGGLTGDYPDSDVVKIGPVVLTKKWKEYTIDLTGADLSYISGGFCWAAAASANPGGLTFYLDDIKFE